MIEETALRLIGALSLGGVSVFALLYAIKVVRTFQNEITDPLRVELEHERAARQRAEEAERTWRARAWSAEDRLARAERALTEHGITWARE